MLNYTLQDMLGMAEVLPFFGLALFAPGYLIGFAANVLDFRMRGVAERVLLSLTLSCAVSPFLINILCRFLSVRSVSYFFLAIGLVFAALVCGEFRRSNKGLRVRLPWTTTAALWMALGWLAICMTSLPDLQLGTNLYSTSATFDHAVRSAFIASAQRTGAPPANPFFYPGHAVRARYYYYWKVLCAVPAFLSGASARVALYASCFWSGLCLAALLPLYLKHFLERRTSLRWTTIVGLGLLAITGLDLIPSLLILLFPKGRPFADMEWWDPVQVTSWIDSLLWVPHHVASLVACLTGFLLLWKAVAPGAGGRRFLSMALASAAFASGAGLSVYVALTFAWFVLLWMIYLLVRGRFTAALWHGATGLLAAGISAGYLGDLLGPGAAQGGGAGAFLAISVRQLPVLFRFFPEEIGRHSYALKVVLYALFVLLTLFLELGIYFAVGVAQWKQDWKHRRELSEAQICLWTMALASLTVMLFLKSTVIEANDLAWRGSLLLEFALLLWAAIYLSERVTPPLTPRPNDFTIKRRWRVGLSRGCAILILIGGASSAYQLGLLRFFNECNDKLHWQKGLGMASGPEAYAIRAAYAELDRIAAPDAIVQTDPESEADLQLVLYSRYQQVDTFPPTCGTPFGGSMEDCRRVDASLNRIYHPDAGQAPSASELTQACRSLKIDMLVVDATDAEWKRKDSWVWRTAPAIQNDYVRIYSCDAGFQQAGWAMPPHGGR